MKYVCDALNVTNLLSIVLLTALKYILKFLINSEYNTLCMGFLCASFHLDFLLGQIELNFTK